jgi:hypothetical protein
MVITASSELKRSNHCVQATPDCALLFVVAQLSGAPDPERSAKIVT